VVKTILYKRTIALGTSTWYNFRKDLRRSEPIVVIAVDLGGGRKEAVKTGGRIHNITKKMLREIFSTCSQRIHTYMKQHG